MTNNGFLLLIFMFSCLMANAQWLPITSDPTIPLHRPGNVGIGTTWPMSLLSVSGAGSPDYTSYFHTTGDPGRVGLCVKADQPTTTGQVRAIQATITSGKGYAVAISGFSYNDSPDANGSSYGVRASSGNAAKGENYGLFADLLGSNSGTAVFGHDKINYPFESEILPEDKSYAGYFIGKGYFRGDVGIGTNDPQTKLHINGDVRGGASGGALRINSNSGYVDVGAQSAAWCHIYTDRPKFILNKALYVVNGKFSSYSGNNLELQTNGTTRLKVMSATGNVGIGTSSPENKLDVCGIIRAEGVTVASGWCDYVFEEDYQLPTIQEEADHIEKNGHLSGFESEAAMEGEIVLEDVTKRQQEKIEQMMLHIIAMDKEIKALKTQLDK